jgi:hypothetical protein
MSWITTENTQHLGHGTEVKKGIPFFFFIPLRLGFLACCNSEISSGDWDSLDGGFIHLWATFGLMYDTLLQRSAARERPSGSELHFFCILQKGSF